MQESRRRAVRVGVWGDAHQLERQLRRQGRGERDRRAVRVTKHVLLRGVNVACHAQHAIKRVGRRRVVPDDATQRLHAAFDKDALLLWPRRLRGGRRGEQALKRLHKGVVRRRSQRLLRLGRRGAGAAGRRGSTDSLHHGSGILCGRYQEADGPDTVLRASADVTTAHL